MKNFNYRTPSLLLMVILLVSWLLACQKGAALPSLASDDQAASLLGTGFSPTGQASVPDKQTGSQKSTGPAFSASSQKSGQIKKTSLAAKEPGATSLATSSQTSLKPGESSQAASSSKVTTSQTQPQESRPAAPATTAGRPVTSSRPTTGRTSPAGKTGTTTTTSPPSTKTSLAQQPGQLDYRQLMRDFVIRLSDSAKARSSSFLVIVQNGEDVIQEGRQLQKDYLSAVDGIGREDFLYGASRDDVATSSRETTYIKNYLDQFLAYGNPVLITDYCFTPAKMLDSYSKNKSYAYISFAAEQRELNEIPSYPQPIYGENNASISSLAQARNFLYLINPGSYKSKSDFLTAIAKTNYDLVIVDLFYNGSALTKTDLAGLKQKSNGGRRLVIAYMSIGEAEDYRFYWQKDWRSTPAAWLGQVNPDWPGNYLVKYWDPAWQNIIIDRSDSYLNRIIAAGFDGVYLDLIDAYEYYS